MGNRWGLEPLETLGYKPVSRPISAWGQSYVKINRIFNSLRNPGINQYLLNSNTNFMYSDGAYMAIHGKPTCMYPYATGIAHRADDLDGCTDTANLKLAYSTSGNVLYCPKHHRGHVLRYGKFADFPDKPDK